MLEVAKVKTQKAQICTIDSVLEVSEKYTYSKNR